ncbi:geranylgeranyl diphosphate synthase type II [Anaerotaenia torta]|uniref:polyprenyl synthetase family protein n=1 Tax=Anaerotaenia torta TaxID=433293 RepID=UPI003D1BC2C1
MNFDQELKQRVKQVEDILGYYAPREEGYQKQIMEAMNYSLMAGGKRLRPILMHETYRLFSGEAQAPAEEEYNGHSKRPVIGPFMAAIEMIHTYSLVHDDLPAMDNDDYRRGRETTHVRYGEAMGILAGDGLLNYAFETAVKSFDDIADEPAAAAVQYRRRAEALRVLAAKAGIYGMIGGQVIDMEEAPKETSRNHLDHMYRLKTGALVEAAMMIGAILAGASREEIDRIEQIAGDIGLAFQIRDDILDVTSSAAKLGKPVHSDEKNEKTTYISFMDPDTAGREVARISDRAMEAFASLQRQNEFLRQLIAMLVNRES